MIKRLLLLTACLAFIGPGSCKKKQGAVPGKRASRMVGRTVPGSGGFDGLYVETRPYMGTIFRIIVALNPQVPDPQAERARAAAAVKAAFHAVADIEAAMSDHIAGSQVSRINQRSAEALAKGRKVTKPIPVGPDLMAVLQEALQASKLTSGAFDVSYAALKGPWGMKGDGPHKVPSQAEITKALSLVGYKGIQLDPQNKSVRLRAGMRIDLGGVAKGYALDIASKILKDAGFPNHIVYGGGDLNVSGRRPKRAWRVGIQDPGKRGDYFAVLSVTNMAVVTSGDYERYFVKDGRKYAHIIDPRTGRPARGLHSVTVVADRAVYADAMATGLFVLGLPRAKSIVEHIPGTEAIFVTQNGKVVITSGLKGKVDIVHPPTIAKKKFSLSPKRKGSRAARKRPVRRAARATPVSAGRTKRTPKEGARQAPARTARPSPPRPR